MNKNKKNRNMKAIKFHVVFFLFIIPLVTLSTSCTWKLNSSKNPISPSTNTTIATNVNTSDTEKSVEIEDSSTTVSASTTTTTTSTTLKTQLAAATEKKATTSDAVGPNATGGDSASSTILQANWLTQLIPLPDLEIFVTPQDGHQKMIDAIEQAQTSIHMMIFHMSDEKMINSLIQARTRGVDVAIIMDQSSLKNPSAQKVFDALQAGGVNVVKSSSGFSITHVKSFVVDKKKIFITTMNFIKMFNSMRDFGLVTTNANLINEFESVFAQDLKNAAAGKDKTTPDLSVANLVWSPVNSQQKISQLIDQAGKEVEMTVESISDANVVASLGNAAKRGVQVRIITPECMLGPEPYHNERSLKLLVDVGVDSRLMPMPQSNVQPYMHAKTIQVDGKYAFVGSENFSINSLMYAREFGVVFTEAIPMSVLKTTFEDDWKISTKLAAFPADHCAKMQAQAAAHPELK